jgi:hypothetical protein
MAIQADAGDAVPAKSPIISPVFHHGDPHLERFQTDSRMSGKCVA